MLSHTSLALIRSYKVHLKKPVRLVLFTSEAGCLSCPEMVALCREIKKQFPLVALESYDLVMDRDKSLVYGVTHVPALAVESENGTKVVFYGLINNVFLDMLLNTIVSVAAAKKWFPENIGQTLRHLENAVAIRVFAENDCTLCRSVSETAIGMAFENSLIHTDILVAGDFPALVQKRHIQDLPTTIFGENFRLEGHITESEFLEMILHSQGITPGPDRTCLVCGTASPDIICPSCKIKIQAEALDHKIKSEKGRSHESL